jgi:hypothetical protein
LKEKGGRLGLVLVVILSMTTHPLQYWSFELDMQETSATEVCESLSSFLSSGKGVRLGLVVEGEGRAPETCACGDLVYDYTSPSVPEFRARHARNKRY